MLIMGNLGFKYCANPLHFLVCLDFAVIQPIHKTEIQSAKVLKILPENNFLLLQNALSYSRSCCLNNKIVSCLFRGS